MNRIPINNAEWLEYHDGIYYLSSKTFRFKRLYLTNGVLLSFDMPKEKVALINKAIDEHRRTRQ